MKEPLEGVTVLDVTEVWAGPMGISLLGDLGARVIKVESFPRMSTTRIVGAPSSRGFTNNDPLGPRAWDRQALHNMANRNKYGVTLNLAHPVGLDVFKELVKVSDVLVEGYSSGTAERLGIHYSAMRQLRPDIIMASMPGWGVEGPYKGYVSLGSALDAFTGHHALRGYPDTDPSVTPVVQHPDAIGAVTLAFAVLVALYYRNRTGKGQFIDISQVESFLPHLSRPMMDYVMNGRQPSPIGNRDHFMAPHGCYRCRGPDDWVVITVSCDEEWKALCRVMGDPDWTRSERFADSVVRYDHQDEMDNQIGEWTSQGDKKELMRILQDAGVPAEAVLNDEDLYADPHLEARGFFQKLKHPLIGEYRYPGYLWKLGDQSPPVPIPPNGLGEHNRYVYGSLLGMSEMEIEDLENQGIIGSDAPAPS